MTANMGSEQPSVFKAVQWLAIAKLGVQLLSWVGTYYTTTLLLPSDYGLSTMATAFTQFANLFASMGIGVTIIQRQSVPEEEIHNLFTLSLLLGSICAVASYFLAYAGGWFFHRQDIIHLTQFTAVIFISNALSIVPYNILNRDMRFRERAMVDVNSTILSMACQVFMARAGFGAWSLLGGVGIRAFLRMLFSFYYSRYIPILQLKWEIVKKDLAFSVPLTFNSLLFELTEGIVPMLIGRFYSATQLGYYSLAYTLSEVPNQKVVQIIREILLPLLSRKEASERIGGLFTSLKFCTLFITPAYMAGFYFGTPLINALFPNKWTAMAPIFAGLCLLQIFKVMSSIFSIFNTANGEPARTIRQSVALVLLLPLSVLLFRSLPLYYFPYIWTFIHASVFSIWVYTLMRRSGPFLGRLLLINIQVLGACSGLMAFDFFGHRFLPHADNQFMMIARAVFFLLCYLAFIYSFHWPFVVAFRKK
ncbi:MAG: polysaccharide biosynthesis protein [Verrucomicrobiales bacterium]|nr:polysaccharide biosynthesis protein [Verrucomicrobiales bacterium]